MGLLSVIRKRCVEAIIPLAWLATSTLFLALHFPVWYHHHIFALAPMSWLASYSILLIIDFFSKSNWFEQIRKIKLQLILPPLVSGILLIYGFLEIPALIPRFSNDRQEFIAINILKNHEQIEPWVFVDKPILAFRANLLVPPELAVLSIKRFASGNISFQDIPAILEKYKPDQILLSRFAKQALGDSTFSEYLRNNYVQLDLDIDLKKKDHFIYYIREST
jgi:hypothetical protein